MITLVLVYLFMDISVVRVSIFPSFCDDVVNVSAEMLVLVALVTVKRFPSRVPRDRLELLLVAVLRLSTRHPFLEERQV